MKTTRGEFLALLGGAITSPLAAMFRKDPPSDPEPIVDPSPLTGSELEFVECRGFDPDEIEMIDGPVPLAFVDEITIDWDSHYLISKHHHPGMIPPRFQGDPHAMIVGRLADHRRVGFKTDDMDVVEQYHAQFKNQPRGISIH